MLHSAVIVLVTLQVASKNTATMLYDARKMLVLKIIQPKNGLIIPT
jgi:hypothetical protein